MLFRVVADSPTARLSKPTNAFCFRRAIICSCIRPSQRAREGGPRLGLVPQLEEAVPHAQAHVSGAVGVRAEGLLVEGEGTLAKVKRRKQF